MAYEGGSGGSGAGSVGGRSVIIQNGIEYSEEQWWRRQVLDRLDRIVALLDGRKSDGGGTEG